jgi:hypothetical protein
VGAIFVTFVALLPGIIKTETEIQRKIIAQNLADEGMEMLVNLRENNMKKGCFGREINPPLCYFPEGADPQLHLNPIFTGYFEGRSVWQMPKGFQRNYIIWFADDQVEAGQYSYLIVLVRYNGERLGRKYIQMKNWGEKKL